MALDDNPDFFIYIPTLNDVEALRHIVTKEQGEAPPTQKSSDFRITKKDWVKILLSGKLVVYAHLWDDQKLLSDETAIAG